MKLTPEHFIEQVIEPSQLWTWTSQGWSVVERLEFDAPIAFLDPVTPPTPAATNGYGYQTPPPITRYQVGRTIAFRVRQDANNLVADLTARVAELDRKLTEIKIQKNGDATALEAEKAEHAKTKARLEEQQKDNDRVRAAFQEANRSKRQMEVDLSKVREHIGRKAFDEILLPREEKS